LNNGNYGLYNLKKEQVYTCQLNDKTGKGCENVNYRFVNDLGATQEEKIPFGNCQYRVLLTIKQK
jgi:hypothetical protein